MSNISNQTYLREQYKNAANLNDRIQLHVRFSTNRYDFHLWVFDQLKIAPDSRVLELGCGRGEYTVNLARFTPSNNYIGVDIKGARIWRGAKTVHEESLKNVGFLRIQIERIENFFSEKEVSEIWITFPDPQPQLSRERKRLTSPRFLAMYKNILVPGGRIHLKTDNKELYEYSLDVARQLNYPVEECTDDLYSVQGTDEVRAIKTTYEQMFLKRGLKICYLRYRIP